METTKEKFFTAISNAIKNNVIDGITVSDLLDYKVISYSPGTAGESNMELWKRANISAVVKGFTIRDGEPFNLNRFPINLLHLYIQYDKDKEVFSITIPETEL